MMLETFFSVLIIRFWVLIQRNLTQMSIFVCIYQIKTVLALKKNIKNKHAFAFFSYPYQYGPYLLCNLVHTPLAHT